MVVSVAEDAQLLVDGREFDRRIQVGMVGIDVPIPVLKPTEKRAFAFIPSRSRLCSAGQTRLITGLSL